MTQAPLTDLAPVLRTTPEALQAELRRRGYVAQSPGDSLDSVASAAHVSGAQLLFELLNGRPRP